MSVKINKRIVEEFIRGKREGENFNMIIVGDSLYTKTSISQTAVSNKERVIVATHIGHNEFLYNPNCYSSLVSKRQQFVLDKLERNEAEVWMAPNCDAGEVQPNLISRIRIHCKLVAGLTGINYKVIERAQYHAGQITMYYDSYLAAVKRFGQSDIQSLCKTFLFGRDIVNNSKLTEKGILVLKEHGLLDKRVEDFYIKTLLITSV